MCVEVSRVFKCGFKVIVRNIFCPASLDRTLCEPVETMKKHLSQRCPPCYKRLAQGWNTAAKAAPKPEVAPATAVKPNPALAAAMPVGGNNKRKAAPGPEQERPVKKAKTEVEVKREHEHELEVDERKKQKKLEYQRQYRQKQALQRKREHDQVVLKAMALVAEAMDLAQRAGAEAAALVRARAEAQAQHDKELAADLNAAFEEEELSGEEPALTPHPAPTPAAPLVEDGDMEDVEVKEDEDEDEDENEDESDSEWESDRDSSFSYTDSSLAEPTLLELRGEPLRYLMPVAELVPCHGYYFKIPSLQPHSAPELAHCCVNCFQLEHVDEEGTATLMRAYDMFDGGYWSEGQWGR